jgi:hypothetical protein
MNEAETRAELIDPVLRAAGWGVIADSRARLEVICPGRIEGARRRNAVGWAKARLRAVPARCDRWARFALPTLIWGPPSQVFRSVWNLLWCSSSAAARGAMRSAARRRGRRALGLASGDECNSLHHLISGRTVWSGSHIPHACGEEATRMRPIYESGSHHVGPRVARSSSIPLGPRRGPRCGRVVTVLRLHHRLFGNQTGREIAPQRHD